jgi:type I restriction enzyme M protein
MQFDVCLANPPYSMKKWDREAWKSDPWGRNIYGTPSQGNADYAFFQHILCSLKEGSGRCAILWPHGVLFRDSEKVMRSKLVDGDLVEAVIGLGPNLFYNSTMESCIVVCRKKKPKAHREKILFVNATGEIVKENSHAFLSDGDINKISKLYSQFDNISGLTHVAEIDDIRRNDYKLSIPLYVQNNRINEKSPALTELLDDWERSSDVLNRAYPALLQSLRKVAYDS